MAKFTKGKKFPPKKQAAPEQFGFRPRRYGDGGKIVKDHLADTAPKKPDPAMLGSGLAARAGNALKNRKSQLDKAIEDAGG